jgi:hypothetical protein
MSGNWISKSVKNPGYLHRATHTAAGEIIPQSKIMKAEHADNPHKARAAHLAETLEHLKKRSGGGCV